MPAKLIETADTPEEANSPLPIDTGFGRGEYAANCMIKSEKSHGFLFAFTLA